MSTQSLTNRGGEAQAYVDNELPGWIAYCDKVLASAVPPLVSPGSLGGHKPQMQRTQLV